MIPSNPPHAALFHARRMTFLIGGIVTGVLALSLHVFVLAALNIPTPQSPPPPGVLTWIDGVGRVVAVVLICRYTIDGLRERGWSAGKAALVPFVLFAMFSEILLRDNLMNIVVSQSFAYPAIAGLIRLVPLLVLFALCALVATHVRDPRWLVPATIAVWACMKYVAATPLKTFMKNALSHAAALQRPEVYSPPYDWHVYIPAYLTYAEPVIAIFLLLALMWDRLPGRNGHRCALMLLMLLLAKGLVFTPLAYAVASPPGTRLIALLAMGQFTLETTILIVLAIMTRMVADTHHKAAQQAPDDPADHQAL